MAAADQIKALIKAHIEHEGDKFKTTVLQIAAYSLVVSLSTPKNDVDLYIAIVDKIPNYIQTEVSEFY